MNNQQQAFAKVLDLLEDAGCLRHVVLVGSWAEFVYREAGVLPGFEPNIKTLDVDFLIKNLRRPTPAASLAALAREKGFFVESDRLNGTTKLMDASSLEVEFLIGKRGAGVEPALKTNVGVTAQALRHMEVLSGNAITVLCLGHAVNVPKPAAYAVHKMVINEERGAKSEKDAAAIANLFPLLNRQDVRTVMNSLSKRERARAVGFMEAHDLEL